MEAAEDMLSNRCSLVDKPHAVEGCESTLSAMEAELGSSAGQETVKERDSDTDKALGSVTLLSLPYEIREKIYIAIFHDDAGVHLDADLDNGGLQSQRRYNSQLMVTCSQIWKESLRILYGSNDFYVKTPFQSMHMAMLLNSIGPTNAGYVQTAYTSENYKSRPGWLTYQDDFDKKAFHNLTNLYHNFYIPRNETAEQAIKAFIYLRTKIFQRFDKLKKVFVVSLHTDMGGCGDGRVTILGVPASTLESNGWNSLGAPGARSIKLRFCERDARMKEDECTVSVLHRCAVKQMEKERNWVRR